MDDGSNDVVLTFINNRRLFFFIFSYVSSRDNISVVFRSEGQGHAFNEYKLPTSSNSSRPAKALIALMDTLVELEKSKEQLHQALEKERELSELKPRFVTMASHEFRTPLSVILSSAYIIRQYASTVDRENRHKHLLKIQNAVQALTFILEAFLSFEKLQDGYVRENLWLMIPQDINAGSRQRRRSVMLVFVVSIKNGDCALSSNEGRG